MRLCIPKTVAARGFVSGRGPRPQAVGGIGPKVRSFEYLPSESSFLLLTEKYSSGTFDHIRKDAAELVLRGTHM